MPNQQISMIANQLANEGKKPTVALIKSRLTNSLPLFEIINTLKTWQHDAALVQANGIENEEREKDKLTEAEGNDLVLKIIDEKLRPLKQEIAEIKQLLLNIEKKLS